MTIKDLKKTESFNAFMNGLWRDHPIFSLILGICSALAVSNRVENALAMGAGVTFVLLATALIISSLRNLVPMRVRIITYMITIASFVIIVDKFLKAYFPTISESIGPYVGLIITNCIIMGRAEAFYIQNKLGKSVMDALGNGLGYTFTLTVIAVVRELLGFGTILGFTVMPEGFTPWVVMAMAPGAFFVLALFIWISRTITGMESK
ncbi:MAG: NADH:ubiquinone reductase (Na(+)-transporting) subunit D [Spirochaetales bacterium]|nr:NADH:ubiquinone reductase (Na(+)-transporting) subunit D [Spirochaetales bacterium]